MTPLTDDVGNDVFFVEPPRRVVSLVPSLTESIAFSAPGLLVGATDWCSEPAHLEVARVGGTKSPNLSSVEALRPDLVVANAEENRAQDLDALRAAGVPVWVTAPSTVDGALRSLAAMFRALGVADPEWIQTAARAWDEPDRRLVGLRVAAFVWRKPWMAIGRDTFAGDVLQRLGLVNVFADDAERYPRLAPEQVATLGAARQLDVVVLPDEPYRFTVEDGPDHFPALAYALVSGRHLTWYGPSMVEAPAVLGAAIARPDLAV